MRVLNRSRSCCFARREDNGDFISDRNFISSGSGDICQNPGSRRFDLHRRLVGLDLHERLTLFYRLTFGLEPLEQNSSLLRHAEGGHNYIGCHGLLLSMGQRKARGWTFVGATGRSPSTIAYCLFQPQADPPQAEPFYFCHWITLSAFISVHCGIVKPIWFAVLRLITNSNFIGCSTGRSEGLAPFRIRSTKYATRR